MSILQKLFNFIHINPRASHFKIRDLNVYFKESINPTYKLVNLDNIESLELMIEPEEKEYNLVAYIKRNGEKNAILLATFETKKEAENAFHKVKNTLFGGGKTLLSIANGIVLILIYSILFIGFLHSFKNDSNNLSNLSSTSLPNFLNSGNSGNVNIEDISKLQKQLLQQALKQAAQQGVTGIGSTNVIPQNMPNSSEIMNDIVKEAIQQSQGQSSNAGINVPQQINTPSNMQAIEKPSTPGDDLLKQIK